MRKSTWLPIALLLAGSAFYVYDGMEYNSLMKNLPLMIIDVLIVAALFWALRKKEEYNKNRPTNNIS